MSVPRELLAVFARAPALGKVKTRLCPPLTADEALALHRALVEDTLEHLGRLQRPGLAKLLLLTETLRHPKDLAIPPVWTVGIQAPGDLGERLASLFYTSFRRGTERVVVVGSDSPTLPLEILGEALDGLGQRDVVLGPAEDGGYYLVGARRWIPKMFQNIAWGTGEVLNQTTEILKKHGVSHELLIPWYDVDRGSDLEKLRQELDYLKRASPELVPHRVDSVLPEYTEDEYSLDADSD